MLLAQMLKKLQGSVTDLGMFLNDFFFLIKCHIPDGLQHFIVTLDCGLMESVETYCAETIQNMLDFSAAEKAIHICNRLTCLN